ncbi:MAG: FHA domain-containing protein [Alphaproteobacteria bacterium]|nr:FHA domain-containing protein [Alphaproteobacteria bacterium]
MTYPCPKNGCDSTEPDWCSECGAPMRAQSAPSVTASPSPVGAVPPCPDCGTPRADLASNFCEVCRYDFAANTSFSPAAADPAPVSTVSPPPSPPPAPQPPSDPLAAFPPSRRWDLQIDTDSSRDPNPAEAPSVPTRIFSLDLPETLIGRRNDKLNIHPEIPVESDEAVSKRHARIFFDASGQPRLVDLNSSNGTMLNGIEVPAGVPTAVQDGDVILIGRWTRMTLKAR